MKEACTLYMYTGIRTTLKVCMGCMHDESVLFMNSDIYFKVVKAKTSLSNLDSCKWVY